MSKKEALHILMQSPMYYRINVKDRKELLTSFLELTNRTEMLLR